MNGYKIDGMLNILAETKYSFHGRFKNDTIPFELQLKKKRFLIANTSVKIPSVVHWILYHIKDGILYFFDSFENPFNMSRLDVELFFYNLH